eukprot:GAFH01001810.1.p1 GENE.GAFH01001810.1~~GAFH01001810.1.p1  ORF type:complete len:394 (-),score=147.40 GAFH01001810.1:240-1304(-)
MVAIGFYGDEHAFEKPWFTDWSMFVGMMGCFPVYWGQKLYRKSRKIEDPPSKAQHVWLLVTIPALCDMVSTFMMNVGLLWIPASIWQMLRGSIVIFTAILAITVRKQKLPPYQWVGVLIVFVAEVIVGAAAIMQPSSGGSSQDTSIARVIIGISLVILAQFLQALQTIIEESLLHDVDTSPVLLVGYEGLWGFFFCTFVAMPIVYFLPGTEGDGIHEDTLDSFVMLGHNGLLLVLNLVYTLVICLFNIYGMFITEVSNAVTRNILESLRTLFIWVLNLIMFYATSGATGEAWTWYSFMQLGGFVVLCAGLFIYNAVIKIPALMPKVPTDVVMPGEDPAQKGYATIPSQVDPVME